MIIRHSEPVLIKNKMGDTYESDYDNSSITSENDNLSMVSESSK